MEDIELKSKVMQQMLGTSKIVYFEQIAEAFSYNGAEYTIIIPDSNISEEEMQNLIDDCKQIAYKCKVTFSVANLSDELKEKFIIYAIKDNGFNIDLADEEEVNGITDEWENTKPQISEELYDILRKTYKKEEISLWDIYSSQKMLKFNKIEHLLEFMALFPNERYIEHIPHIRICCSEDIQNLINYGVKNSISLYISDMSVLSIEDLQKLSNEINISKIYISSEHEEEEEFNTMYNRYDYTIEEYIDLKKAIDRILADVDLDAPDIEKFLQIYKKLGNSIVYDFDNDGEPNKRPEAHNLIGGLLQGKCVCEGYALALKQVLKCAGIDCKYITDNEEVEFKCLKDYKEKSFHSWNQVRIDGVWYNCDLTWDAERINCNREMDYCLQNDEEFLNHSTNCKWRANCHKTYSISAIRRILNPKRYLRENIKLYCEGQGFLTEAELRKECEKCGLNFEEEIKIANGRAELDADIEQFITENEYGISIWMPDDIKQLLQQKAEKIGLDFKGEYDYVLQVADFRADMRVHYKPGMKKIVEEWLKWSCESVGLDWENEVKRLYDKQKADEVGILISDTSAKAMAVQVPSEKQDAINRISSLEDIEKLQNQSEIYLDDRN